MKSREFLDPVVRRARGRTNVAAPVVSKSANTLCELKFHPAVLCPQGFSMRTPQGSGVLQPPAPDPENLSFNAFPLVPSSGLFS